MNPLFDIDFYKADHRNQYPEGTEMVFSNFTPRSDRLFAHKSEQWDGKAVVFGVQAFVKEYLIKTWNENFFHKPKTEVIEEYKELMNGSLGENAITFEHVEALWDLQRLPLVLLSMPEGTRVSMKIPTIMVYNSEPDFFWFVNYLESVTSSELWPTMNSATIAFEYRRVLNEAAIQTGAPTDFVPLQGHDFSFRGMGGREAARKGGMGHLLSFMGSDTVPAIRNIKEYYDVDPTNPVGVSVFATEHSVMCLGEKESEIATFRRLINELYPTGIISIVSDTWDYWKVITEYLPELKDEIMARQPNAIGLNKVVIRPDSGDPVRIICGYKPHEYTEFSNGTFRQYFGGDNWGELLTPAEIKGSIQCLWDTFGGTETETGHKLLDEHIGLIYGDSITLARATEITERLAAKGFASTNVVFGIGSYTYQYNTRDSLGFAMKATAGIVNGEIRNIFKDPKTDNGTKKSAKGFLRVVTDTSGEYVLEEYQGNDIKEALEFVHSGVMRPLMIDGLVMTYNFDSFENIKERLEIQL